MAFVPLGTPPLAGPGAIVAPMPFVPRIGPAGQAIVFGIAIVLVIVLLWLAMRFSGAILRLLRGPRRRTGGKIEGKPSCGRSPRQEGRSAWKRG